VIGGVTYNLILDTGSSNTWVGAGKKYVASGSSTNTNNAVSVSYGSGSFSGTEYLDSFTLGDLTVPRQSIGVASTTIGFTGVDGIFGVGPVGLTEDTVSGTNEVPTVLDNLYSSGSIPTEVLGVYFQPIEDDGTSESNGEITLGGTDSSKYTGNLIYAPITTSAPFSHYWGVVVDSISYGQLPLGLLRVNAIVDTGTTLIYIPEVAYALFLVETLGREDSDSELTLFDSKPTQNFVLTIAGTRLALTPEQYLVPQPQYKNFGLTTGKFYAWINVLKGNEVDFIIGQKFLEHYYSVYDTTNARVGFAPCV